MKRDPLLLEIIYASHQGKISDKWSIYLKTYERLLSEHTHKPWRILEIGIQNGGSLEIWARYFPDAAILVGCDINSECRNLRFDDARIAVVVGDANADETQRAIEALSPRFDLVIDDGSHTSRDIVLSFARYFPKLDDGGIFVAEDLHCSYWADFEGGLLHPASSMTFFKWLADVVNHEHWGVPQARRELLAPFARQYGTVFDEEVLAHIHSIEFVNSMCIVRKLAPAENTLGRRVVRGVQAQVDARPLTQDGSASTAPSQADNPWSVLDPLPADELRALRESTRALAGRLQEQQAQWQAGQQELQALRAGLAAREAQLGAARAAGERFKARAQQAQAERRELAASAQALAQQLQAADQQLHAMRSSAGWKLTAPLRSLARLDHRISRVTQRLRTVKRQEGGSARMLRKCAQVLGQSGPRGVRRYLKQAEAAATPKAGGSAVVIGAEAEQAARDIFQEQQAEFTQAEMLQAIAQLRHKPLISVVMPVYKTPVQWLARVVESLQEQLYENWELCAVDDCSPGDEQRQLLQQLAQGDPRVRCHFSPSNGGISAASNIALEMARGQYIALVDHDDEITPDAFYWVAKALNDSPQAQFLYSDECKIDDTPERRLFHFVFKPQWSPAMLFNGMLTGHLTVYDTALVRRLGGFRKQYDFSQDYDLALRVAEQAGAIVHIERILYLWRSIPGSAAGGGKDFARESNIAALNDYLARNGIGGTALALPQANRVEVQVPPEAEVSVVIPSDSYDNLKLAITALLDKTDFLGLQIVAVCNSPLAERLAREFADVPNLVFSRYDKPYNFSDKCNQGARDAAGGILVFYNDDVFPIAPDWVTQLIEYLYVPGVGGVSPKLLYPDETIQYAGMIAGTPGLGGTAYNHVHRDANDPFLSMHKYVREVSILSGACCAVRKDLFWQVGGFDAANTPHGHSDLDLSFKLMEAGYRCLYTPYTALFHIGHGSWNVKKGKYKADIFVLKRWGRYVDEDPHFTDSMKRVLYTDFRFRYKVHAAHLDPARRYTGPDVLFVSHELSLTGAPRMLFYAAKAVLADGGFPVVTAPQDGPMRQELVRAGIAVIIDESITHNHFLFGSFAKNFDTVVVNTSALEGVVRQLQQFEEPRLLWWLHEGQALQATLGRRDDIDLARVRLLCVSEYARRHVPAGYQCSVLHNGVPDQQGDVPAAPGVRSPGFTFVLAGTIEPRKGQDVFAEAVMLLPPEVRGACRFVLTGKLWDMHLPFWRDIQARTRDVEQFEYRGLLEHGPLLQCMAGADVVVCASRDEPFSLTAIEAAMLGKPVILNRNVGIASVLEQQEAALLFECGDAASLAAQMRHAFEHADEMRRMGARARLAYERELTVQRFSQAFLEHVRD